MAKKTTAAERTAFIEEQRANEEKVMDYRRKGGRFAYRDMSFIDRKGNIVRPTRDNPFPTAKKAGGNYHAKSDRANYHAEAEQEDTPSAYESGRARRRYHQFTAIIGITGILTGIFFLSPNLTGNAISNMTNSTSNMFGAILLVVGLVAGFFWVNGKK